MRWVFMLLMINTIKSEINYQTEINMLKLCNHWEGLGVSFLYPNKMKLLSSKLKKQIGIMKTYGSLIGGMNWKLDIELNVESKNEGDTGIVFWVTKQRLFYNPENFTYENYHNLYGGSIHMDGFMILVKGNDLMVNYYQTDSLDENMIKNSKICKINKDERNNYFLRVKYTEKDVLGIYIVDKKNSTVRNCTQFPNVDNYEEFFLSISSSDNRGSSAALNSLIFFSNFKLNFVEKKYKKKGDQNFSFFTENTLKTSEHLENYRLYKEFTKENEEKAKILAKKLLTFVDKDQKEIFRDIKSNLQKDINSVDNALGAIKLESVVLQNYANFLVMNKKKKKGDLEEVFDQLFNWIEQVDNSYDKVESETLRIFNSINNYDVENNLYSIFESSDVVLEKLNKFFLNKNKLKLGQIKIPPKNIMNIWEKQLKNLKKDDKTLKKTKNSLNFLKKIGISILFIVGFVIILLFLLMYLKISKVNNHKRIL